MIIHFFVPSGVLRLSLALQAFIGGFHWRRSSATGGFHVTMPLLQYLYAAVDSAENQSL